MKLYHYPQTLTQNGLKILRPETVKFQEDDQGVNSLTAILVMISFFLFLILAPKSKAIEAKINRWDHIKLKNLHSKGPSRELKENLWNGRKYLKIIYLIRG